MLVAVIERFLDREIAFRERIEGVDYLVFPSHYTREAPFPGSSSYGIRYDFAGPLLSIFATLAVRLSHNSGFSSGRFYRNAAAYEPVDGGRCAILFQDLEEGRGRLSVFFEDGASAKAQTVFLEYIYEHLVRKAVPGSIVRRRAYHCPQCGYLFDDQVVERRLERGDEQIVCSNCDTRSPLYDLLLDTGDSQRAAISQIDADARAAMHRQLGVTAIQGKKRSGAFDLYLAYAPEDRGAALWLAELLQALGLRPWVDVWQAVPGQTREQNLQPSIQRIRAVLVAAGRSGEKLWQDSCQVKVLDAFELDRPSTLGGYWTCLAGINGSGKSSIPASDLHRSAQQFRGPRTRRRVARSSATLGGRPQAGFAGHGPLPGPSGQRVRQVDHHPAGRSQIRPASSAIPGCKCLESVSADIVLRGDAESVRGRGYAARGQE